MELTLNTSITQTQIEFSQTACNRTTTNVVPQQTAPALDHVELSEESRRPRHSEHTVSRLHRRDHSREDNPFHDFLRDMIGQIIGRQVDNFETSQTGIAGRPAIPQPQAESLSASQANLSVESTSISIDGAINTSDGAKLSFSLDLQVLHASASTVEFNSGNTEDGFNFTYAGSAAELAGTSFSFTLSAETPDGTPADGIGEGTFSLKNDMKEIRHALKPLLKELFKDTGNPYGWSNLNRLLHTVA